MELRKLAIIVNPTAGKKREIVPELERVFTESSLRYEVYLTEKEGDEERLAHKAVHSDADAIAVYGGDGTVTKVIKAVFHKDKPLLIIPGGSANALAKGLGMPSDYKEVLSLIAEKKLRRKWIDMAYIDDEPLLNSITAGFIASIIINTSSTMKDKFGFFAYVFMSTKLLLKEPQRTYELEIDGEEKKVRAVSLSVTNGIPTTGQKDNADGKLDIVIMHKADVLPFLHMALTLLQRKKKKANTEHIKAKELTLRIPAGTSVLVDDIQVKTPVTYHVSVKPAVVELLVPVGESRYAA